MDDNDLRTALARYVVRTYLYPASGVETVQGLVEFLRLLDQVEEHDWLVDLARRAHRYHLRTLTHIVIAYLAHHVRGADWLRPALRELLSDPLEVVDCLETYQDLHGHALPNALCRTAATVLEESDALQLLRASRRTGRLTLRDVIRVAHPRVTPTQGVLAVSLEDYLQSSSPARQDTLDPETVTDPIAVPTMEALMLGLAPMGNSLDGVLDPAPYDLAGPLASEVERLAGSRTVA